MSESTIKMIGITALSIAAMIVTYSGFLMLLLLID